MIKNIYLSIATFVVMIFVMEVFFNMAEVIQPITDTIADRSIGTKFKPNANVHVNKEGFYLGKTNKYGYIGPAYGPENDPNTLRIALFGDSYVEAFHLFDKYSFRNIMEDRIKDQSGINTQVLNFGQSGMDFKQAYLSHDYYMRQFDVDYSLVFINQVDLEYNSINYLWPDIELDENNELTIDRSYMDGLSFRLKEEYPVMFNSSTVRLLKRTYDLINRGEYSDIVLGKFNYFKNSDNEVVSSEKVSVVDHKKEIENYALNSRLFANMRNYDHEVILVLVTPFTGKYLESIQKSGLKVINLHSYISGLLDEGLDLYYWKATNQYGHWNHEAHDLIGRYLAKQILKNEDDRFEIKRVGAGN